MLQTTFGVADGARCFNVSHATIMWLRYRFQQNGTTWNHPCSGKPPGAIPSQGWRIRLKHPLDQWRTSTRSVVERPGCHNTRISRDTACNHLDFTAYATIVSEAPSWTGIYVLQCSTGWPYNVFPFSICLTQDFPRSNAVHILPWPAYSPSCNPSSIGDGPHWLPNKVTRPTSIIHRMVMPGNIFLYSTAITVP